MGKICLYLLGAPRLERDNKPVQVDTRKAIAMLAYLALEGKQHGRDSLAALLWPEYSQSNARAALRRTLSALHRALGGPLLEASREMLELPAGSGLWVDVHEFHCSLQSCETHGHPPNQVCQQCLPHLENAARLYRDHFMAGFSLRDSVEFDDWQFLQSEGLLRDLSGALERLVAGFAAQGGYPAAISYAVRWLALDALHEPAHRQLMQLYALAGQRSAALRQYQECVRILEKGLGVAPLEETTQLYREIKEERGPWSQPGRIGIQIAARIPEEVPPTAEARDASQAQAERLPFIGRDAEKAALLEAYAAIDRDGFMIVLEGEAGIGKTRLAEEFLSIARSRGAASLTARCYPGETNLAYAPFIEGLKDALEEPARQGWQEAVPDHWLSEAARLLPGINRLRGDLPAAPPVDSPGAQARFFEGLSQVILALCGQSPPGVLFFDDLHWADEASLDLLTYLVRRLRGRPVLVLITWQGEHLPASHRLRHLLAEAQRNGYGEMLYLSRLSPEAVGGLVRAAAAQSRLQPAGFSQRLYQETEGLPFFVSEYLAFLPDQASWEAQDAWPLPHGVRDLLRSRLERAGETGIQLLQAAAVIGRSFDFDTLREASGRTDEETVSTLERLVSQGLIREGQHGSTRSLEYDFSHEKLRALVYNEISLARRRLLHLRTAEALLAHARGRHELSALAGQIAHHYKQGGGAREAAEYYRQAGDHARSLYANAEALAHFQASLALGSPDTAYLNEAIGDMNTLLGSYRAAIQSYDTALAHLADDPGSTARLRHKLGEIYHRIGEWDQAEGYFKDSAEILERKADPGALARLYADWSRTAYQRGQVERARQMTQQALDLAQAANDLPALAQALNILGILARSRGALPEAIRSLEHSLDLAERMVEPAARIAAMNNLSLAYADSGNLEQAIAYAQQALELCIQLGDRHRQAALYNNLADLYHMAGREDDSMSYLKQAVVIFSEVGGEMAGEAVGRSIPEIWKLSEW